MNFGKHYKFEMPWGAAAAIGGALISSNAAGDAADAQSDSAAQANATQKYMYDTTRADNAPFLANGTAANNRLSYLLGLGGTAANNPNAPGWMTMEQAQKIAADNYARTNPLGLGDDLAHSISIGRTRQSDADATAKAIMDANNAAITQPIAENDPAYGSLLKKFGQSDLNNDVVYNSGLQFGLDQGTNAINQRALQSGGYDSGATLKALTQFGNDYGSTKANDAYNRYNTDNTNIFNRLSGISGMGQTASSQVGAAGQNYANQVSNNQTSAGNARSAGIVGSANAWGSGLTGAYNAYQNNQNTDFLKGLLKPATNYTPDPNYDYYG